MQANVSRPKRGADRLQVDGPHTHTDVDPVTLCLVHTAASGPPHGRPASPHILLGGAS